VLPGVALKRSSVVAHLGFSETWKTPQLFGGARVGPMRSLPAVVVKDYPQYWPEIITP
jgi:hypothetical protein